MRRVLPMLMSLVALQVLLCSRQSRAEAEPPAADWLSSEDSGPAPPVPPAPQVPTTPEVAAGQARSEPGPRLSTGSSPASPSELPAEPKWQYYGWQIMLADMANLGVGLATHSWGLGIGGYFALPLGVHIAHGEPLRALGSAGLRFALPVGLAWATARNGSYYSGMLVGSVLASLIDISALGWEAPAAPKAPGAGKQPAKAPERKPWVEPRIQPLPHGMSAGLVGEF